MSFLFTQSRLVARQFLFYSCSPRIGSIQTNTQCFSSDASEGGSAEQKLIDILKNRFPKATDIAVVDISGGCGSMYEVYVEAPDFKGVRTVKQHQLVTEALKAEIPAMHGLRISTQISACS
ncbi:bolA-like protein 3 [Tigriopus californicus]|uniref:bolA-like protein 3 n=1 Tax=Tigriopus californicus TaxID=6832 RepID=UPI0027DA7E7C|nr:bolA-like protein 3 [Tigriopus californicus]